MPLKKAEPALLWDMLDAAKAVHSFVSGKTFYHYLNDRMLRGAVERHLEIIGEAAKGVSETFQKAHPEISWHRIIAQRHVLAHEYGEIKLELIWRVATLRIPELIKILEPLVPPSPPKEAHNTSLKFDRFIGIDWSGAENPGQGIQVAQCSQGNAVPEIVIQQSEIHNWKRKGVLDWLIQINSRGERIIVGFDFAFAYPYCDKGAYFPKHKQSPETAEALWDKTNTLCQDSPDFYGGPFYKPQDAMFGEYLHYPFKKGKRYEGRLRKTDSSCLNIRGCVPASVFKCLGAQSVGVGSIAGMRMLNFINTKLEQTFVIWPFKFLNNSHSVVIEIFPRLFFSLAGQRSAGGWKTKNIVDKILRHFGSDELPSNFKIESKDQIDAIISAAAIRHLAYNPDTWQPTGLTECARAYEGWIFGVL